MENSDAPLIPPVRLPGDAELAAAVRAAPLAARLLDLSALDAPVSAHHLPDLGRDREWSWRLATDTGFLEIEGEEGGAEATPGLALTALLSGSDEEVLGVWGDVCYMTLHPEELGDEETGLALLELFVAGETARVPADDLLVRLGLLDGDALTPLGIWAGREFVADMTGQDVPIIGTLAGADAATLLHYLRAYPEHELAEELAGWLAGRDRAQEIADALAEAGPLARGIGVSLLFDHLGEPGRKALEGLLGVPRIGALISTRLDDNAEAVRDVQDIAWVLADMGAALMEAGDDPQQILAQLGGGPDDLIAMVPLLALSDHPDTGRVLRLFIDHHPDPRVPSAARKALRRLSGLATGRPGTRGRKPKKPRKKRR